jgi:hypothetical protein
VMMRVMSLYGCCIRSKEQSDYGYARCQQANRSQPPSVAYRNAKGPINGPFSYPIVGKRRRLAAY